MRSNSTNIHIMLQQILIQYRNTSHTAMGKSSAELMFARKLRICLDLLLPTKNEHMQAGGKDAPIVFEVGRRVSYRSYIGRDKWVFGRITERIGKHIIKSN